MGCGASKTHGTPLPKPIGTDPCRMLIDRGGYGTALVSRRTTRNVPTRVLRQSCRTSLCTEAPDWHGFCLRCSEAGRRMRGVVAGKESSRELRVRASKDPKGAVLLIQAQVPVFGPR
jgi:hypothetical protein